MNKTNASPTNDGALIQIDVYPGRNRTWSLAGVAGSSSYWTLDGYFELTLLPGDYTIFTFESVNPIPFNGIGVQSVTLAQNDDITLGMFYVKRNTFAFASTRMFVLTWQPQLAGTVFFRCLVFFSFRKKKTK